MTDDTAASAAPRAATTRAAGACSTSPARSSAPTGELPPADAFEPNDDTGTRAYTVTGPKRQLKATLDYWDDPTTSTASFLEPGPSALARSWTAGRVGAALSLWRPGHAHDRRGARSGREAARPGRGRRRHDAAGDLVHATSKGWHFVQVAAAPGQSGAYALTLTKQRPS